MCGIVGIITAETNGFTTDEVDAFRDMLLVDTLRGFDSTGMFAVTNTGDVCGAKDAVNGATFIKTPEFADIMGNAYLDGKIAVGHNRWATRGSITDKNAHPFIIDDNLVLVQNGTYRGSHRHLKNTDVDTEAVAHVINEHDDIETALQNIDAAYAFAWYNLKKREFCIIRNDERPLFIAYASNGTVLFASELETILFAASRNNIEVMEKPYLIDDKQLLCWKLDESTKTWAVEHKCNLDITYRATNHPFASAHGGYPHYSSYRHGLWEESEEASNGVYRLPYSQREDSLTTTISTIIGTDLHEYHLPVHQAREIAREYNSQALTKEYYVQLTHYFPGNNLPNCKSWFVIGKRIVPGNSVGPVFYKIFYDKTEADIKDMMADEFFCVQVGTPMEHFVTRDTANNTSYYAVTINMHTMYSAQLFGYDTQAQ